MDNDNYASSVLSKVKTYANRGSHSKRAVNDILDEGFICHVALTDNEGNAKCIPTTYARLEDSILLHGTTSNSMLDYLATGAPVCIAVTLTDGFVFAKNIFSHSFNYRSVVLFGEVEPPIEDPEEKMEALQNYVEFLIPGRWNDCRQPNNEELKATKVLRIQITEASAKTRTGPPGDNKDDIDLPYWSGLMNIHTNYADSFETSEVASKQKHSVPNYLRFYQRRQAKHRETDPERLSNSFNNLAWFTAGFITSAVILKGARLFKN